MKVDVNRLVSLQCLCARLHFLLRLFEQEGGLSGRPCWIGVANLLYPATCVTRVDTDASAADLYDSGSWCRPPRVYDDAQSRIFDDYVSALARYYFVWNAYELARKESMHGRLLTKTYTEGRELFAAKLPPTHLDVVDRVRDTCETLAQEDPKTQERLKGKQNEVLGIVKAGRLANDFRNYLFHGDEEHPTPDDFNDQLRMKRDAEESISLHSYRLVYFTRLTLHLIQALMHAEPGAQCAIEATDLPFLSRSVSVDFFLPFGFAVNLATCWPEERGLALSAKTVAEFAVGCNVPPESLKLIKEAAHNLG